MRELRFLFTRRWLLFLVAIVIVSGATWWLGEWQFHRLSDRKANNAIVRANESRAAVAVDTVLQAGHAPPKSREWQLVTASGHYLPESTVIWRYRTSDTYDVPGIDVVVPLITDDGTALLVDRGFVPNGEAGAGPAIPAPPTGTVTVTGYVRLDGTGEAARVDRQLNTRSLSSHTVAEATGLKTFGGWLQVKSESPRPNDAPTTYALPELGNGPHFFYGLQWWFFGLLAMFGFGYLAWDEMRLVRATSNDASSSKEPHEPSAKAQRKRALKDAYAAAYAAERERRNEHTGD